MFKPRLFLTLSAILGLGLCLNACKMEEIRTPQPDTPIFGQIDSVESIEIEPGSHLVRVDLELPDELLNEGHTSPEGLVAEIVIDKDTIVVVDGVATSLDELGTGGSIAVLPRAGSTILRGVSTLEARASYLLDFASFAAWRTPRLLDELPSREKKPGSSLATQGVERSPLLTGGGRVLYFTAEHRSDGDATAGHGELGEGQSRSFRSELTEDGWLQPEMVDIPGIEELLTARITWVNAEETECLLTLSSEHGLAELGRSTRGSASEPWGEVDRISSTNGLLEADASMLSTGQMVFSSDSWDGVTLTLFLAAADGSGAQPLGEPIFTTADQTTARTAPDGRLLFSRGGRQMIFDRKTIEPIRFDDGVRREISDASVSDDDQWLVFSLPIYSPGKLDMDLHIARLEGNVLSQLQRLDDWRPAAEEAP